jgi:hypothetical protein
LEVTASLKITQEFIVALLIAAWIHVALFFVFVLLLVFDLFADRVFIGKDVSPKQEERLELTLVLDDSDPEASLEAPISEPVTEVTSDQVRREPRLVEEKSFVQTNLNQAVEERPENPNFIGQNNTMASSDREAVAGESELTALAGEKDPQADLKSFDSNFSDGENQPVGKLSETPDSPNADPTQHPENEIDQEAHDNAQVPEDSAKLEETKMAETEDLAELDQALRALEEALADDSPQQELVEPNDLKKVSSKQAAPQNGGFAPQAKKTRVQGVIRATGVGSLDVANTALGRYQAAIYQKLERSWQVEVIRNRSLIVPGNITLYFTVNQNGVVGNRSWVSINGTSFAQRGMIVNALEKIEIAQMPPEVLQELQGDTLELIVTFDY